MSSIEVPIHRSDVPHHPFQAELRLLDDLELPAFITRYPVEDGSVGEGVINDLNRTCALVVPIAVVGKPYAQVHSPENARLFTSGDLSAINDCGAYVRPNESPTVDVLKIAFRSADGKAYFVLGFFVLGERPTNVHTSLLDATKKLCSGGSEQFLGAEIRG